MSQQNTYMDWPKDKLPAFGADGTVDIGISWRLVWSPQSKSARSAEHFSNLYSCERIPMLCLVTWRCSTKNTCHSSKDTAFGLWAAERFPEVDRTFGLWKEHRRRFP